MLMLEMTMHVHRKRWLGKLHTATSSAPSDDFLRLLLFCHMLFTTRHACFSSRPLGCFMRHLQHESLPAHTMTEISILRHADLPVTMCAKAKGPSESKRTLHDSKTQRLLHSHYSALVDVLPMSFTNTLRPNCRKTSDFDQQLHGRWL